MLKQSFPSNTEDSHVIVKVSVLNQLYGTNLYAIHRMASHIVETFKATMPPLKPELVEQIASLSTGRRHMSFASKYCNFFVDKEMFPILDRHALDGLRRHLGKGGFKSRGETPTYAEYCDDLRKLCVESNLHCSTKELDRYLWLTGQWDKYSKGKEDINSEVRQLFLQKDDPSVGSLIRAAFSS